MELKNDILVIQLSDLIIAKIKIDFSGRILLLPTNDLTLPIKFYVKASLLMY